MDELETPTLEWIKNNLDRLASIDKKYWVPGAGKHQYKSYPLSSEELEHFEGWLGVRLPDEYRRFLQVIGYGAGPYDGLLSPFEILQKHIPFPDRPFPFTHQQAKDSFKMLSHGEEAMFKEDWPANGCIPIAFNGYDYTCLVTAGELTGNMWSCFVEDGIWNLPHQPPGIPMDRIPKIEAALSPSLTFLEWYGAWLDQCLSDFDELKRNKS